MDNPYLVQMLYEFVSCRGFFQFMNVCKLTREIAAKEVAVLARARKKFTGTSAAYKRRALMASACRLGSERIIMFACIGGIPEQPCLNNHQFIQMAMSACKYGYLRVIDILRKEYSWTDFSIISEIVLSAYKSGHWEAIEYARNYTNLIDQYYVWAAMQGACSGGHRELVKVLIPKFIEYGYHPRELSQTIARMIARNKNKELENIHDIPIIAECLKDNLDYYVFSAACQYDNLTMVRKYLDDHATQLNPFETLHCGILCSEKLECAARSLLAVFAANGTSIRWDDIEMTFTRCCEHGDLVRLQKVFSILREYGYEIRRSWMLNCLPRCSDIPTAKYVMFNLSQTTIARYHWNDLVVSLAIDSPIEVFQYVIEHASQLRRTFTIKNCLTIAQYISERTELFPGMLTRKMNFIRAHIKSIQKRDTGLSQNDIHLLDQFNALIRDRT